MSLDHPHCRVFSSGFFYIYFNPTQRNMNDLDKNFLLTIEYDGSGFYGWQRQKNMRTVSEDIETALARITGKRVSVKGSGRTDSGVHALGQTASFRVDTHLNADIFKKALNSLLAEDIVIRDCREVSYKFHAQYDAVRKEYHYLVTVRNEKCALFRKFAWVVRTMPDIEAMKEAAACIVGEHDFKSFESAGSPRTSTVRNIYKAEVSVKKGHDLYGPMRGLELIVFQIEGSGFLKYMVRNIMGTLMEVGCGKISPIEFKNILESRDRTKAGPAAPANGLYLVRVDYADIAAPEIGEPDIEA